MVKKLRWGSCPVALVFCGSIICLNRWYEFCSCLLSRDPEMKGVTGVRWEHFCTEWWWQRLMNDVGSLLGQDYFMPILKTAQIALSVYNLDHRRGRGMLEGREDVFTLGFLREMPWGCLKAECSSAMQAGMWLLLEVTTGIYLQGKELWNVPGILEIRNETSCQICFQTCPGWKETT